jgi:predicted enzyme related to lactoylglutathione lyase
VAPEIDAIAVADEPAVWEELGFTVVDGACRVGRLRIDLGTEGRGITAWSVRGIEPGEIDGLVTLGSDLDPVEPDEHHNGTVALDHLVVATPDVERTVAAIEGRGLVRRRNRDAGTMRQVFFRLGEVVLEVVGPPQPSPRVDGPAHFWGLAFTVDDIDRTARRLKKHVGDVKEAVQPGRRIVTVRREAGSTTSLAFMSA